MAINAALMIFVLLRVTHTHLSRSSMVADIGDSLSCRKHHLVKANQSLSKKTLVRRTKHCSYFNTANDCSAMLTNTETTATS
jgi:hypothetical protein